MSSNKKKPDDKAPTKHPGGPIQRKGTPTSDWFKEAVGSTLEVMPTGTLPSKRTVLRRYRFLRICDDSSPVSELVKVISSEVSHIWNCARIPMCPEKNRFRLIQGVIDLWTKTKKKCPSHQMKPEFQAALDTLLDIASKPPGRSNEKNAHEYLNNLMKSTGKQKSTGYEKRAGEEQDWHDDMLFYLDQKTRRSQGMGGIDQKLSLKENRSQSSLSTASTAVESETELTVDNASGTSDSDKDTDDGDELYTPKPKFRRRKSEESDSITLEVPRDLMRKLSPLAYRLKLSTRQQTAFTAGLIKACGGSVKEATLSVTTTQRQRHEGVNEKSLSIKETFLQNLPPRMVLHWDGKKIKYENSQKKDDRLCIIGSFPGVIENGTEKSDQFFGAPCTENGTGRLCAQALVDKLSEWSVPLSMIIGMCWDTTASNTGHISGAATLFEARLMHAILWIGCRHHIGERHVVHPDNKIRVINTTAPTDVMFKKFQDAYQDLPPCNYRLFEWPAELVQPFDFLTTRAMETLAWAENAMREGTFLKQRDDYRELCELVVFYLGGQVIRKRKNGQLTYPRFTMRKPGAFNHARFLAKALYLIKISMMMDVIPDNVVPADKREAVDRMARFIVVFHSKYFLQAFLSTAGPRIDLQYWVDMSDYSRYDIEVSQEVQASILRQLWYLTEELVILTLFDQELSFQERTDIASTLLSFPRPPSFLPGKPRFPDEALLVNNDLKKFIGPRSWLIFDLLQTSDVPWLELPANEWESDDLYVDMKRIILDLAVTNDTAERAVGKVTEYANSANDGGQRGKIVEVAAWHHSKMSAYNKDDLENAI